MNQAPNTLAPSYPNSLVQSEAAPSFLSLAGTETGRKAFLGDPEKFDSSIGPDLTNAHIALRDGVETIGRLLNDATRNDVQRHEVAGVVAGRTVESLQKAKAAIESRAEVLFSDGVAQAEREFTPRASHASLESEIRAYIREQAKQADGPAKVRAAMLESKDVAAVIFHSPGFLVGINAETHSKLRYDATERWVPDAYKRMTDMHRASGTRAEVRQGYRQRSQQLLQPDACGESFDARSHLNPSANRDFARPLRRAFLRQDF